MEQEQYTKEDIDGYWIAAIEKYMPHILHYDCVTPDDFIKELHDFLKTKYGTRNPGNPFGEKVLDIL